MNGPSPFKASTRPAVSRAASRTVNSAGSPAAASATISAIVGSAASVVVVVSGAAVAVLVAMNRAGVMQIAPYVLVGIVLWVSVLKSGVHATLAGVVMGSDPQATCVRRAPMWS